VYGQISCDSDRYQSRFTPNSYCSFVCNATYVLNKFHNICLNQKHTQIRMQFLLISDLKLNFAVKRDNSIGISNQSSSQAYSWDQSTSNNTINLNTHGISKNQSNLDFKTRNRVANLTVIKFSSETLRSIDVTVSFTDS
jgi:hypothetical protein